MIYLLDFSLSYGCSTGTLAYVENESVWSLSLSGDGSKPCIGVMEIETAKNNTSYVYIFSQQFIQIFEHSETHSTVQAYLLM